MDMSMVVNLSKYSFEGEISGMFFRDPDRDSIFITFGRETDLSIKSVFYHKVNTKSVGMEIINILDKALYLRLFPEYDKTKDVLKKTTLVYSETARKTICEQIIKEHRNVFKDKLGEFITKRIEVNEELKPGSLVALIDHLIELEHPEYIDALCCFSDNGEIKLKQEDLSLTFNANGVKKETV